MSIKSAWGITDIRVPNYTGSSSRDEHGCWKYQFHSQGGNLNKDFALYYRLDPNLPARVEVIPYKISEKDTGSFMMIVTPGLDLKPLNQGVDYLFVLDKSGSMQTKIRMLAAGVGQALGKLQPQDRFHIVAFDTNAVKITSDWTPATTENVRQALETLNAIQSSGGTNIYEGLQLGFKSLEKDRATSVILVTDGVTNEGIVDPAKFYDLMKKHDVRLFGFLMGNSANWPLMRTICEGSDGFYTSVSTSDDIVGKIMQAKEKIAYECVHNARLEISGVKTHEVTKNFTGKVFRGQQLVLFGRYAEGGRATLRLKANFTGGEQEYVTEFDFPKVSTENPEIERLWAMSQIEEIEFLKSIGRKDDKEARETIANLGVEYQLVTDETSMLVLSDEAFARRNIERHNLARSEREHQAQATRAAAPPQSQRVDNSKPMFNVKPPNIGGGGGAFGWESLLMLLFMVPILRRLRKG